MRLALAVALVAFLGSIGSSAAQDVRVWSWNSKDARGAPAAITLQRDGSGPLVLTSVSANVACATGPPQRFTLSLRGGMAVGERHAGQFEYRGRSGEPLPADEAGLPAWADVHPALIVGGQVFDGAAIEGAFLLAGDIVPAAGQPRCHARSQPIAFLARCASGCPAPPPATVFPGVGIGGPALGMRGIARIGMTARQILALHPYRPRYDRVTLRDRTQTRRGVVSRVAREIGYARTNAERDDFELFGLATCTNPCAPTARVVSMALWLAAAVPPKAGVIWEGIGPTRAEFLRAYPSARCLSRIYFDFGHYVGACFLLRGGVKRGVVTIFVLDGENVQTPPGQPPIGPTVGKALVQRCGFEVKVRGPRWTPACAAAAS